ncbi:MAG: DUF397 domain-containing protein [Acidimicrobiales bacterium]
MEHDHSAAEWRTSTFSDNALCVEVASIGDQVAIRHSKDPNGPILHFTRGEMLAFLQGTKAGEFDDLT